MRSERYKRVGAVVFLLAALGAAPCVLRAEDSTTRELRQLMLANFEACNHEDLPALMRTMSVEMPNRELFIKQCEREWSESDLYYRLDDIRLVPQAEWRLPYAVATIKQTITGSEPESGKAQANADLSNRMSLNTRTPTTEQEVLFRRERGKWKVVASLTQPREVGGVPTDAAIKGKCENGVHIQP